MGAIGCRVEYLKEDKQPIDFTSIRQALRFIGSNFSKRVWVKLTYNQIRKALSSGERCLSFGEDDNGELHYKISRGNSLPRKEKHLGELSAKSLREFKESQDALIVYASCSSSYGLLQLGVMANGFFFVKNRGMLYKFKVAGNALRLYTKLAKK